MSTILALQQRFDALKAELKPGAQFNQKLAKALIAQQEGNKKLLIDLALYYCNLNDFHHFKIVLDRIEDPFIRTWASLEGVKMMRKILAKKSIMHLKRRKSLHRNVKKENAFLLRANLK